MLGADRTGTVCAIIEALLGVAQSDIDKDYELTSFKGEMRRRSDAAYAGLVRYMQTMAGTTLRDKVVNWAARIGITAAEINAFRAAMIDGTPETVTPDIATFAVTNTLSGAATDNTAAEATQYQPYTAQITAGDGKVIGDVRITMGGTDITADVWRGEETNLYRRVTLKLSGCSCDNTLQRVIDGQSYGATLTPDADYTLGRRCRQDHDGRDRCVKLLLRRQNRHCARDRGYQDHRVGGGERRGYAEYSGRQLRGRRRVAHGCRLLQREAAVDEHRRGERQRWLVRHWLYPMQGGVRCQNQTACCTVKRRCWGNGSCVLQRRKGYGHSKLYYYLDGGDTLLKLRMGAGVE